MSQELTDLQQRWAEAELRGDAPALDALLADDFAGIGPLGFVLDREQYLGTRRAGELRMEEFAWEQGGVRHYGPVAVAVGIVTQKATYRGQPQPVATGRFRVTQIAVQQGGRWLIAGLQFSGPIPEMPPR